MPFSSKYKSVEVPPEYTAWSADPSPANMTRLLTALQPDIQRGMQAHVGGVKSPTLISHAKRIVIDALPRYKPEKAALGTFVVNSLEGLKRVARKQQQVIRTPERIALEQAYVNEKENEWRDRHGRQPNTHELADITGLSSKRLSRIRMHTQPVAEGFFSTQSEDGESDSAMPAVAKAGTDSWLDIVYDDLDNTDKFILERSMGLYGHKPLSTQQIASKLRLSPGAISQRRARIQTLIDQQHALGMF